MLFFAALSPLLFLVVALLVLRKPLAAVAPLAYALTVLLAVGIWQLPLPLLAGALLKGVLLALDIILIVFGAIAFVFFLKESGTTLAIERLLRDLSPDRRIQAVVIAWLFGGFIEGSAGFGTPAAIAAPLLVAIGFPPVLSVVIALAANTTAVTFGAVGAPVRIGLVDFDVSAISSLAGCLNLFAGLCVPLIIIALVVRERPGKRWRSFAETIPWALWAGLAFTIPYAAIAFLGPELPSLIGGAVGLIVVGLSLRIKRLTPQRIWRFSTDAKAPMGLFNEEAAPSFRLLAAMGPYALMITLLLFGKSVFGPLRFELMLPGKLTHTVGTFNPGFAFLTTLALLTMLWRKPSSALIRPLKEATNSLVKPFFAILFVAALVQTLVFTEQAPGASPGMLETLVMAFKSPAFPWLSPTIGSLGSFLAGSATVSNLLFAPLQSSIASDIAVDVPIILAMQLVGAGIGNMIALPNVLAAEATVKISGMSGEILKRLALPYFVYLILATAIGQIMLAWSR